jgi:hypothetical protein
VKHCASCGRDIPESATVCEPCEKWAAEHVAAPSSPVQPLPAVRAKRVIGRELLVIMIALAAGGMLTFGLLSTRGVPATGVSAAQSDDLRTTRTVVPALQPASVATQAWSSERRAYWTANQRHSVAFELPAENTVTIWLSQVRPLLIVRCLSKRTEAFVFTGSALKIEPQTDDHTVSFRFDDEQETTVRWPDSSEHDALFAPDAREFAERLMRARTLRFGYTPHNAAPVEAHFQVSGLTELLEPVAKDCGWKK